MTGTAPVWQSQKTLESYTSQNVLTSGKSVLSLLVKNGFQSSCRASLPYIPENTHTNVLSTEKENPSQRKKKKKKPDETDTAADRNATLTGEAAARGHRAIP